MTSPETQQAALLFALGPVQDFIATARKGQDLWFGSWLLSELSREAAKAAQGAGALLVLPAPSTIDRNEGVANKIIARVLVASAADIAAVMSAAAQARLKSLAAKTFDLIQKGDGESFFQRENAERQISDLLEIYWVAVEEAPEGWAETRRRAEAALAARKSLRDFAPVTWGSAVPKSALDGLRESVIHETAFVRATAERLRRTFGVGTGERLCGVSIFKRNGHLALSSEDARGARVISTAHLASWSLRRAWQQSPPHVLSELRTHFLKFLNQLPDYGRSLSKVPTSHQDPVLDNIDGQVLFSGRLSDIYDGEDLKLAQRLLSTFLKDACKTLGDDDPGPPTPYYAVLHADGDRMGAWLDTLSTPTDHAAAGEALGTFAASAERVVAEHHGHCVFSGGDDVLALLPVQTALDCAAALNSSFLAAVFKGPGTTRPTLSVGIQIAHATDPFRDALNGARAAEYAAKHEYNRAAWAVRLDKRSGVPVIIGDKWDGLSSFRRLQTLQEGRYKNIPRGLGYDLRVISDRLRGNDQKLKSVRALETYRVFQQKDVSAEGQDAIWTRIGSRDAVCGAALMRVCNEIIIARALSALDGEAQ